MLDEVQGVPFLDGHVLLTHDGGQHWDGAALNTNELRPYTEVLSAAALNATNYLLGIRRPQNSRRLRRHHRWRENVEAGPRRQCICDKSVRT